MMIGMSKSYSWSEYIRFVYMFHRFDFLLAVLAPSCASSSESWVGGFCIYLMNDAT